MLYILVFFEIIFPICFVQWYNGSPLYVKMFVFRAGNKGYAYTFITPEQEKFAGDIVRALELSMVPVPEQLSILWETYKAKQAAVSMILI